MVPVVQLANSAHIAPMGTPDQIPVTWINHVATPL